MMRSLQAKRIGSLRLWSADPIIGAHVHRGVSGYNRVTSYRNIQYTAQQGNVVDLRSDTVTMPSEPMFQAALSAPLGDDVMGEDPTVLKLEEHVADMFGKEKALFLPTCTMANLVAGMAHCNQRANEMIIGSESHISLWEGGNIAGLAGVSNREVPEDPMTAEMDPQLIRDRYVDQYDDHTPQTTLLCIENTHNMLGGVALPVRYMDEMGVVAKELGLKLHVDGARVFHSVMALETTPSELCKSVDSVAICLSKGLGSPVGSVLVGETEFIRLAKRARKRCGGGMRQAGVLAAMGQYAIENNIDRLKDDHVKAQRIGANLQNYGFRPLRDGKVDTNIIFFKLPDSCTIPKEEFGRRLETEYGVKIGAGYSRGGELFRIVTHMNVSDEQVDRATEALIELAK